MFEKCRSNYMRVLLLLTVAIYISSLLGSTVDKAAAQTGVVSGSVVNVRSGPSTGDVVIGSLYKDTRVNILAQAGEWYNIQFGQLSGWMHQSVLSAQSLPVTGTPVAVPVQSQTPTVTLDGTKMTFDVPPIIEKGRILVPMAAIFRSMGATVDWNQATQTVTAVRGDTRVILPINSTAPTVNGAVWKLDVPARIVGNRTLAPLRFVGEALGGTVVWDAANFRAIMTSPPAAGGNTGQVEDNTAPVVAVTISSTVNLRGGPDTTYDVVAQANSGETLRVLGQQGNWYLVNRGERNAWVAGWVVNLIREGEAMPPGVKPPVVTPPVVNPSPDPGSQLDGLTISTQRTAEGLKIVMESGTKLKTEQSKGSGSISYEFTDCQIIGTANRQEYLGSSLVTVQGSSQNDNALVNIKFPTWMQYKTASENDGKREVLIIPNYVSEVTRKAFGSSGEIITIGSTGSLQYTSNISSNRLEVVFNNTSIGSALADYNYNSPLIGSMGFKAQTGVGQTGTILTLTTNRAAKFAVGPTSNGNGITVMFIDQSELQNRAPIVVLDAGHGGKDPGASGASLTERDVNLPVVLKVGQILTAQGIKVVYTRQDDTFLELKEISDIANFYNAAVFVSVHCNGSTSSTPSGTETWCYYPASNPQLYLQKDERYNLALRLQQALVASLGRIDRGVKGGEDKAGNLSVLRCTTMPSALVEMAFITNPTEEALLAQPQFRDKAAQAIADGIAGYMHAYVKNR